MKSRKGFTLIELLAVFIIIAVMSCIIIAGVVGCCMLVKGAKALDAHLEAGEAERADRLVSNPPIYDVGDIVYHKASNAKMVVVKNSCTWNDIKQGWNIKVKDGGQWDKVGGFSINEVEVKLILKKVEL